MKSPVILCSAIVAVLVAASSARASIYGTMSNFDTYNETETDSYGAEIEIEGIHIEDIHRTFPAHYDDEVKIEYQEGGLFGTRIVYTGYNFSVDGFLPANTAGVSTNGHACVATDGCEHFGFSVTGAQPSAARFYWLDQNGQRIGDMPVPIPSPSWNYVAPGNGGDRPRLAAEVEVPEPPEIHEQKPDSIWMKVFKTEIDRPVDLMELMSDNAIVPDGVGETESEWELLEGGADKADEAEDEVDEDHWAVIRRYEFYEYTGPYDEENEPTSIFLDEDLFEPPAGELGQFISANMVAANLAAPQEPDFDQDGSIGGDDFLQWQRGYGHGDRLDDGDADWDDDVDHDDLVIWEHGYQGGDHDARQSAAAVPEPATWSLLILSGLGALGWRRAAFAARRPYPSETTVA